jgi:parallel beta-helix repeat protein
METLVVPASSMTIGKYGTGPDPIINAENTRHRCVWNVGHDYVTIQNLDLRNAISQGIVISDGASYVNVLRCAITGTSVNGIIVSSASELSVGGRIAHCTVSGISGIGIQISANTRAWTVEYNTVEDCVTGGTGAAIKAGVDEIGNQGDHVLQYNTCRRSGSNGIWVDTICDNPVIVRYNRCETNTDNGIYIEVSDDCDIHHNICIGNDRGILIKGQPLGRQYSHRNVVYNNVCYGNGDNLAIAGGAGAADSCVDNVVRNNICAAAIARELACWSGGENDGTLGSGNIYTHNCLGAESIGFILWGSGVTLDTYDAWETAYGASTHSVRADPLFEDVANDDFRLQAGSPCIDAGVDVGLRRDYLGHPVPQGNAPDIGAYERQRHIPEGLRLPQRIRDRYRAAKFVMGR